MRHASIILILHGHALTDAANACWQVEKGLEKGLDVVSFNSDITEEQKSRVISELVSDSPSVKLVRMIAAAINTADSLPVMCVFRRTNPGSSCLIQLCERDLMFWMHHACRSTPHLSP